MAISRLQAALGMVTNEVTVAAAQINFDFTLVKREAPAEYHALGESLSEKRRHEAEAGRLHRTARRLGALFEGVCPPTPDLVKAYGIRVSETSNGINPTTAATGGSSAFKEYLGVDGTSIWAAATSSNSAIQVQLLTCMIGRMFDMSEAVSIWVELVKSRRQEVASQLDSGDQIHFASLSAAANTEITRAELAEWDASARAWLETADSHMERQQKKLMLILDNLGLAVDHDTNVHSSVISAWKKSVTTMNNLIGGKPQAVEDEAAILGLASWHIYPDMVVLSSDTPSLRMSDVLVTVGGILTVGMQRPSVRHGMKTKSGIYWSLSLAHLRYYGEPVLTEREISSSTSRVMFDQFGVAVLGCLLETWKIPQGEVMAAADLFIAIEDAAILQTSGTSGMTQLRSSMFADKLPWFQLMVRAARILRGPSDEKRNEALKLLKLGQRRAGSFTLTDVPSFDEIVSNGAIPPADNLEAPLPYFGLIESDFYIRHMINQEEQIRFLRATAERIVDLKVTEVLIRVRWRNTFVTMTAKAKRNPYQEFHCRWYQRTTMEIVWLAEKHDRR